ncbi:50S ribosomal protein L33 [Streptomyces sp. NPDC058457]|uniref:50S ribosomal protein L33 n=1 Tax=Streptomyces sp. NPDC058457 TaxID=3346507 RepID=UPI003658F51E
MARNELRPVIRLRSTAGTGYTYVTRKNRRNDPDRMTLRKFDPVAQQRLLARAIKNAREMALLPYGTAR